MQSPGVNSFPGFFFLLTVSVSSMGQHLGKRESPTDSKVRALSVGALMWNNSILKGVCECVSILPIVI